ncbi:MAG TPA: hypothetical protein GXZ66_04295 [Clostridiaceae bacterium]|nr:hypothetical protein [Clostridiaceae bacterium]
MRRIVTIALVFILVLLSSVVSVNALFSSDKLDKDDLDISVEMGYNNRPIEGRWMPVNLTIENKTNKNIEGNLVLSFEGESEVRTSAPIVLPPKVAKTTTLYVYYKGHTRYRITLENDKGKTLYETTRHNVQSGNNGVMSVTYIGIMTENRDSLNYMMQMEHIQFNAYSNMLGKFNVNSAVRVEALDADNFPVSKVAIDSFDAIFVNDFDITSLTGEQKDAFDYYIKTGGYVIFGTGSSSTYAFSGMSEYVENDVGELTRENVMLWVSRFNQGGGIPKDIALNIVEIKDNNLKLLNEVKGVPVAYKHDKYNLYYLTFSLADNEFTSWAFNYEYIFEFLLNNTHALVGYGDGNNYYTAGNTVANILGHSSENFLPSILLIVVIIVVYMLIVGPVSYAILKKKDKRELMWIIIPIVVVVFSVTIFMYGYLSRGGGNVASTLTIVELNPYSDLQKPAYVATTVMTSSNGNYKISYDNDALFGSNLFEYESDHYMTSEESKSVEYRQDIKSSATVKGATMWSFINAESVVDVKNYGRIETEFIVRENGNMTIRLKNNTGYDLEKVVVTIYDKVNTFDYFKYLDTVDINYSPVRTIQNSYQDRVRNRVMSMFNAYNHGYGYYGDPHINSLIDQLGREEGIKAGLLLKLLTRKLGATEFSMSPQMHIAGFVVDGPDMNVMINDRKPSKTYNNTIVHQSVSLHGYVDLQSEEKYLPNFIEDFSYVREVKGDSVFLDDPQHYAIYEISAPREYIMHKQLVLNISTVEDVDIVVNNFLFDSNTLEYIGKGRSPFKFLMSEFTYRDYSVRGSYIYEPVREYVFFHIRIEPIDKSQPLTIESVTYEFSDK